MLRFVTALALFTAIPGRSFAANPPKAAEKKTSAPAASATPANNPELAAAAAVAAAQGWINLLRDPSLADWQRAPMPAEGKLDPHSPWRYDAGTGILLGNGAGNHELLLHPTVRADGIFHVEWRFAGEPDKPDGGVAVRVRAEDSVWHLAELTPSSLGMLVGSTPQGASKRINRFNYGKRRPDLLRKAGDWNVTELVCIGSRVMLHLNGVVTAEFRECQVPQGLVGLELDGAPIEFRAVKFRPLP